MEPPPARTCSLPGGGMKGGKMEGKKWDGGREVGHCIVASWCFLAAPTLLWLSLPRGSLRGWGDVAC